MIDERYRIHNELVNKVLVYIHSQKFGRFWSNPTGAVKSNGRFQRYGLLGSSDIIGIDNNGRFVAIEIKTKSGALSKHQKLFKKMIKDHNGIFILIHDEIKEGDFDELRPREIGAQETDGRDQRGICGGADSAEIATIESVC